MNNKPTIFLSYARPDKKEVEKLYQKLTAAGYKPWMDTKDLVAGEDWRKTLQKAIKNASFFIVCLSNNSVNKRGVIQEEIKEALGILRQKLESDIYLIPVRLNDCEIPESLAGIQYLDLFNGNGLTQLLKTIRVGIERRQKIDGSRIEKSELSEPNPTNELSEIQKELLITDSIGKLRKLLFKIDEFLSRYPNNPQALLLREQILTAINHEERKVTIPSEVVQHGIFRKVVSKDTFSRFIIALLSFLVGTLGNLIAAWLQKELLKDTFTPLRIAAIISLVLLSTIISIVIQRSKPFGVKARKILSRISIILIIPIIIIAVNLPVALKTPEPIPQISYLELNLSTGSAQQKKVDSGGAIDINFNDIRGLNTLSGRAVFLNRTLTDTCSWAGRVLSGPFETITANSGDCRFSLKLPKSRFDRIYLRLTVRNNMTLFVIKIH